MRATVLLAAAPLIFPLAVGAQTLDLPPRKPGLWEITMTMEKPKAAPGMTTKACLDPSTDREMMNHGLKLTGSKCAKLTAARQGQSYVIDADCAIEGIKSRSKTVITGDFGSAYTVRTEGTIEGAPGGPQVMAMTQAATWKSADCPGMKPGDVSLPGGLKINIKQMKGLSGLIR